VRALALLVLLAGCARAPVAAGPVAFCDGVADRDPAVKALVLRGMSEPGFFSHAPAEIDAAKAAARADCLKRQGVTDTRDGVQAPARDLGTVFP
jgi:hypothetical protein